MAGSKPSSDAVTEQLRRLAALLDEAQEPISSLDLPRVEVLTQRQQGLIEQLGPVLDGVTPSDVDPALVADVRRKLLRNRVLITHVLDFAARIGVHLSEEDEEGYGADGQARVGDVPGRLLRTSV